MDFKNELKKYQDMVNSELDKYVRKEECPEKVLNSSMEYSLMAGGKRLRPILAIATYKLFDEDYSKVIPYAVALEMVHNFSLIHDDLPCIDNDDFRHGKPTNHKMYDECSIDRSGYRYLFKVQYPADLGFKFYNEKITLKNIQFIK
jgi:geranylgeranyl diphosphate synthase type II